MIWFILICDDEDNVLDEWQLEAPSLSAAVAELEVRLDLLPQYAEKLSISKESFS